MTIPIPPSYKSNFIVQGIIYTFMMLSYVFGLLSWEKGWFILGTSMLLLLGILQLLCAMYYGLWRNIEVQREYLKLMFVYIVCIFAMIVSRNSTLLIVIPFFIIIPIGIATWYIYNLWQQSYPTRIKQLKPIKGRDDLLDDLFNSN